MDQQEPPSASARAPRARRAKPPFSPTDMGFGMLFERTPDAVIVADVDTGRVVLWSPGAEAMFGYGADEVIGSDIAMLMPERMAPLHRAGLAHYRQTGHGRFIDAHRPMTVPARRKDGTELPIELTLSPIEAPHLPGRFVMAIARDVSEQQRLLDELRTSEHKFRALVEHAPMAVFTASADGTITYLNRALPTADPERVVGRNVRDLVAPEARERVQAAYARVLATGESESYVAPFILESGKTTWWETCLGPIRDDGRITGLIGIANDVTEQHLTEEKLHETERRLRTIVDNAPLVLFAMDPDGVFTLSVGRGLAQFGYAPGEVVGRSVYELYAHNPEVLLHVRRALAGEKFLAVDPIPELGLVWETHWGPLHDAGGRLTGAIGVAVDVTLRHRAEEALQEREALFRLLAENATDMITLCGPDRTLRYVSPASLPVLGYMPDELLGRSFLELVHPQDAARLDAHFETLLATTRTQHAETFRARRKDGREVWLECSTRAVRDALGRPTELRSALRDITERKQAEERLQRSERQLSEAQRLAHLGSWEWDIAENRLEWSAELKRIYGVAPGEFSGTFEDFISRVHPDRRDDVRRSIEEAVRTQSTFEIEEPIVRPDGEVRTLHSVGTVVLDEAGRPVRLVGTCHDITELKGALETAAKREAELESARELQALRDAFVKAVSHELRTPLTSLKGYLEFLEDEIAGPLTPQQREFVEQLTLGTTRLDGLVEDLLDYARMEAGTFRLRLAPGNMAAKMREIVASLEPMARAKGIAIGVKDDGPQELSFDEQRIGQVLLNLLGNAIKFTPQGGRVQLELRRQGDEVRVSVSDTGPGVAAEDIGKLFQAFSQLEAGRRKGGSGLGLAIAKAIVEAHGGAIGVEDAPDGGACFWFTLPASVAS